MLWDGRENKRLMRKNSLQVMFYRVAIDFEFFPNVLDLVNEFNSLGGFRNNQIESLNMNM